MSVEKTEVETFFGRCRCCLAYGYLKNMWIEHQFDGEAEVYGEMLVECFALTWEHSEDSMEQDQICEQCIFRLRDASDFKKVVLNSQEELLQEFENENSLNVNIKEERLEEEFLEEYKTEVTADTTDFTYEEEDTEFDMDTADNMTGVKDETEYEEIEYLEDEDASVVNDAFDTDSSQQTDQSKQVRSRRKQPRHHDLHDVEAPQRKWPKKLPKSERQKTYKQYSEVDLRKCLEEVRNNVLTANEASIKYDIPKKTICAKIRAKPNADEEVETNREKMFQLIKEIKTILTFTNATPYKSKNIRYYCAYCSTDGPHFEDPDDLRTHTRTEHVGHRTEKIEYAMRPYWMNEVIKLDIENLLCTVCCVVINNWNEMFRHLKDKHNVHLDQAYTRVIPYVLRSNLQCALCKESFSNYLHLDGHMNAHYNNYVCDDCGDTFLARTRLKQHIQIHNTGKFSCSFCEKVFTLQKYRRKHEETVHEQRAKYRCQYCPERFAGEYLKHLHCLSAHPETVKTITCEFCGDSFTWKQYYTAHIRKKHQNKKPYECSKCNKKFFGNYELKEHMLRHVGVKNFECPICHKRYVSTNSLKQHMKQHKKKGEIPNDTIFCVQ
ncbi:hypothetical protein PYW08_012734 [Mythimna loreyi]|uniref:Uncharacterized protein n=1 Tax=Mythimna loreyi TaxID=667449 RepID=A0ACC2Q1K6_9NEOP|nr:hypothetical protein PYW08_012734 [Mythimna loreyi]